MLAGRGRSCCGGCNLGAPHAGVEWGGGGPTDMRARVRGPAETGGQSAPRRAGTLSCRRPATKAAGRLSGPFPFSRLERHRQSAILAPIAFRFALVFRPETEPATFFKGNVRPFRMAAKIAAATKGRAGITRVAGPARASLTARSNKLQAHHSCPRKASRTPV